MPLKQVEMNFADNPTWESLEAKEKSQPLWALSRTAKNMFGVVSQVLLFSTLSLFLAAAGDFVLYYGFLFSSFGHSFSSFPSKWSFYMILSP